MRPDKDELLALLERVGETLHGGDYSRALARDLGPLHPGGPRDSIDDSLVRKWRRGSRGIPAWVGDALLRLCRDRRDRLDEVIADLVAMGPDK